MKTLNAMFEETVTQPRNQADRRKKRPEVGMIHWKEVEQMLKAALPKGVEVNVYESGARYNPFVEINYKGGYGSSADGMPSWKARALRNHFYSYTLVYTDSKGWATYPKDVLANLIELDRMISLYRKSLMESYREYSGIPHPEAKPSLKGKPRRVVQKGDFEVYFSKIQNAMAFDSDVLDFLPTIQPGQGESSRTWGIEIEVAGSRGIETPAGWDAVEDGSLESPYAENTDNCECSCDDCAPEDGYDQEHCMDYDCASQENYDDSREFVSPILKDMYSRGVTEICDGARFEPQNESAGVHIHVGSDGMTPKQIGGLVYAYGLLENMLATSYKREKRYYCRSLTPRNVTAVLNAARTATEKEDVSVLDRYVTVNVEALEKHGTIEFRAMGPVYDSEYLHKWALFVREMVNVAAADVPMKRWNTVKNFDDVLNIFREYGTELNQIEAKSRVLVAA